MYNCRIGRFFAIDPLYAKYPYNSPYAFSENRVIDGVELEGLEYTPTTTPPHNPTGYSGVPAPLKPSPGLFLEEPKPVAKNTVPVNKANVGDATKLYMPTVQPIENKTPNLIVAKSNPIILPSSVPVFTQGLPPIIPNAKSSLSSISLKGSLEVVNNSNNYLGTASFVVTEGTTAFVAAQFDNYKSPLAFQKLSATEQALRTTSVLKDYTKPFGFIKGIGTVGTLVSVPLVGLNMYSKATDGDPSTNIDVRDGTDMAVATASTGGYFIARYGLLGAELSNPVGWVIGIGSGLYSVGCLMYDNPEETKQMMNQGGSNGYHDLMQQGLIPFR